MLDWESINKEYKDLLITLSNSSISPKERAVLQKKASHCSQLLGLHKEIVELEKLIEQNKQNLTKEEGELRTLYEEEIANDAKKLLELNKTLEDLLYPQDKMDERSVFIEIRAGTGGQEAALFAADLFKMYLKYAEAHHWKVSILEFNETDIGGYKELVAFFDGKNVYKYFKYESGVHRVQRVPKTEASGRIHTSTVTVAVLPEVEEVDISINPSDLRIDVYRSSGAGGQHVNTTDSAVRIIHIPTGVVVTCQDERSQIKNKAKALKVLQARLYESEREKREAQERAERKQQIGTGERAEKIRTYNFPQNRVTDHRTNVTLKKLDLVMLGDMDDLLLPLIEKEREDRRKKEIII
jgi:peptide chain release factor 1